MVPGARLRDRRPQLAVRRRRDRSDRRAGRHSWCSSRSRPAPPTAFGDPSLGGRRSASSGACGGSPRRGSPPHRRSHGVDIRFDVVAVLGVHDPGDRGRVLIVPAAEQRQPSSAQPAAPTRSRRRAATTNTSRRACGTHLAVRVVAHAVSIVADHGNHRGHTSRRASSRSCSTGRQKKNAATTQHVGRAARHVPRDRPAAATIGSWSSPVPAASSAREPTCGRRRATTRRARARHRCATSATSRSRCTGCRSRPSPRSAASRSAPAATWPSAAIWSWPAPPRASRRSSPGVGCRSTSAVRGCCRVGSVCTSPRRSPSSADILSADRGRGVSASSTGSSTTTSSTRSSTTGPARLVGRRRRSRSRRPSGC